MPDSSTTSSSAIETATAYDGLGEPLTLTGTTNESVTLKLQDLLYIEAVGNYLKVCHLSDGRVRTDMLRATMKQMDEALCRYPVIVRCHRAFLVNLSQVERVVAKSGTMQLVVRHCDDTIPVSRSNMAGVKESIRAL
jgi:DNA-binding LytR/AlgR family response regulator